MRQRDVIIKAALVLALVWACVWGVRSYAGSRKITAERVNRAVAEANFADWSARKVRAGRAGSQTPRKGTSRNRRTRQPASISRNAKKTAKTAPARTSSANSAPDEKTLFIDLTVDGIDGPLHGSPRRDAARAAQEIRRAGTQGNQRRPHRRGNGPRRRTRRRPARQNQPAKACRRISKNPAPTPSSTSPR